MRVFTKPFVFDDHGPLLTHSYVFAGVFNKPHSYIKEIIENIKPKMECFISFQGISGVIYLFNAEGVKILCKHFKGKRAAAMRDKYLEAFAEEEEKKKEVIADPIKKPITDPPKVIHKKPPVRKYLTLPKPSSLHISN